MDKAKILRLIDANALKKAIADAFYNLQEIAYITDIIERQPTIEAEPVRHGRWECGGFCSECGLDNEERKTPYCPNCGTKMDAEEVAERRAAADDYAEY